MNTSIFFALILPFIYGALPVSNVISMNDNILEEYIAKNPIFTIVFVAPFCSVSKSVLNEVEKAAKTAKTAKKPYVFAKIDGTMNTRMCDKFKVSGFPHVKQFINGSEVKFDFKEAKDITASGLITYLDKITRPPSVEITTLDQLKNLKPTGEGIVQSILLTTNTDVDLPLYASFISECFGFDFYHITKDELIKTFQNVTSLPSIVLLKPHDEPVVVYEAKNFSKSRMHYFYEFHRFPIAANMTMLAHAALLKGARTGVILFRKGSDPDTAIVDEEFKKAAAELRIPDYLFVISEYRHGKLESYVAEQFELDEKKLPHMEILVGDFFSVKRYVFKGNYTKEGIISFIYEWKRGNINQYFKTEEEPKENPGPVYKAVATNFKSLVLDNDDDIMVKFYAPWCGHCKELAPIYEDLAESLKHNKKMKFFEVDATLNHVPNHYEKSFPTIKFFPGKAKANFAIYDGPRTKEGIIAYLKTHCSNEFKE